MLVQGIFLHSNVQKKSVVFCCEFYFAIFFEIGIVFDWFTHGGL